MRKQKYLIRKIIIYIILVLVSFIFLFPTLWVILASFSKSGSIYSLDGFFPSSYSLDSFKKLFIDTSLYNYPRWFMNTLIISSVSCIVGTFFVILTAYTMSRMKFSWKRN